MSATSSTLHYFFEAKPLWTGTIGSGGVADAVTTTIPLSASTNLDNGDAYIVRIGRVDASGARRASNLTEVAIGELSGTNLINSVRGAEGTAQSHVAGTVVEILFTATHWNKMIAGIEVEHNPDGTHKTGITLPSTVVTTTGTQTLTNKTLTSPVINTPTGDVATKTSIQDSSYIYAADGGSTDAYAITLSPAPALYAVGQTFRFKANTINTGAATLNVNSLGAKTIKKNYNSDLADGDIKANQLVEVIYDGTNFQLLSPVSSSSFNSGFAVWSSVNQSIASSTLVKIQMNNEEYDLGNEFDSTTNYRFTATNAGKYTFSFTCYFNSLATGKLMGVAIFKNGAQAKQNLYHSAGNANLITGLTVDLSLAANDYIEFYAQHDDTGNKNTIGGQTNVWATGHRFA